jgi:hypothetical protein
MATPNARPNTNRGRFGMGYLACGNAKTTGKCRQLGIH